MTPLDKTLKRSLKIGAVDYVLTLTPEALKLTRKGKRLGMELKWADITSGESALAVALHASVGRFDPAEQTKPSEAPKAIPTSPKSGAKRNPHSSRSGAKRSR